MPGTVALVVAAGRGSRFGAALPKQYAILAGRPVLRHALEAYRRHPGIDAVQAVIHPDDRALYDAAVAGLEPMTPADVERCRELIATYRDLDLGLVDSAVIATAERLDIRRVLTVDERDFRVGRPKGDALTLLPADA